MLTDKNSVLMLHLLRDSNTISRLVDKVLPEDVSKATMDNIKGFLWKCSKEYYSAHGGVIPQLFLEANLQEIVSAGGVEDHELTEVCELLEFVYSANPDDFNADVAVDYAKEIMESVRVHEPLRDMLSNGAGITELFDLFQDGMAAASVSTPQPIDPMASWEDMLGTIKPEYIGSTDVDYFNKVVNGGLCPGEIVILMGPMGGFKTTMAIDLVCSLAKECQHSMYISYEQSYQAGDLPIRFFARMSGVDRDILMRTPMASLTPEQRLAVAKGKENSKYILFQDRSQNGDSVEDIANMVQTAIREGRNPRIVVIDQLMTWMSMWPSTMKKGEDWFRKLSTEVVKTLKTKVCEKYGVNVIILHQIAAADIGKNGGQTFSHTQSAENKGIGFWADFVLTIGSKDHNNRFMLSGGKSRRGNNQKFVIEPMPATCQFKIATNFVEDKNGRFVRADAGAGMFPAPPPPGSGDSGTPSGVQLNAGSILAKASDIN